MQVRPNPDLSIRKIDNEVFIYDRNRSLIHTFNETGAFLWNAFEQGIEKEEIVKRLVSEYEIDETSAATDMEAFFSTLHSLGLAVPAL